MSEQFFSTTRLTNVMKLIALGHQTGLLQVTRGGSNAREEGFIQFVDGEIAMASVGQLRGQAALAILLTWGETNYQFLDGVNQATGSRASDRLVWNGALEPDAVPPSGSGSLPGSSFGPSGSQPGMTHSGPFQAPNSSNPGYQNGVTGGFSSSNPSQPGSIGASYPAGAPIAPGGSYPPGTGSFSPGFAPRTGGFTGGPSTGTGSRPTGQISSSRTAAQDRGYIPQRLSLGENSASLALDRRERQILLLIDGRRSVADLVRLTRRGEEEIQTILAQLIAMNLVR